MAVPFAIIGLAFASFGVWLIIHRRARWAKLTLTAVVCTPILYVASFGPACWAIQNDLLYSHRAATIYCPLVYAYSDGPPTCSELLFSYARACGGPDAFLKLTDNTNSQIKLVVGLLLLMSCVWFATLILQLNDEAKNRNATHQRDS